MISKFRIWRENRGLEQSDIADVWDVSQSMVSLIETEKAMPSSKQLALLHAEFAVKPMTLGYRLVETMVVERLNGK